MIHLFNFTLRFNLSVENRLMLGLKHELWPQDQRINKIETCFHRGTKPVKDKKLFLFFLNHDNFYSTFQLQKDFPLLFHCLAKLRNLKRSLKFKLCLLQLKLSFPHKGKPGAHCCNYKVWVFTMFLWSEDSDPVSWAPVCRRLTGGTNICHRWCQRQRAARSSRTS